MKELGNLPFDATVLLASDYDAITRRIVVLEEKIRQLEEKCAANERLIREISDVDTDVSDESATDI